jgi:hypothetical protein
MCSCLFPTIRGNGLDIGDSFSKLRPMNDPSTDIRPVLRARLTGIDTELVEIERRREALFAARKSIERALDDEDRLAGEVDQVAPLHPSASGMGFADLLLRLLDTGPKTLDQLKDAGAGWPLIRDHKSPKRAINFALVGMSRGGHVERLDDGRWRKK